MEKKYHCYTDQGSWYFYASASAFEAVRLALYYCWRDGENFDHITDEYGCIIRLCMMDRHGNIETLP